MKSQPKKSLSKKTCKSWGAIIESAVQQTSPALIIREWHLHTEGSES